MKYFNKYIYIIIIFFIPFISCDEKNPEIMESIFFGKITAPNEPSNPSPSNNALNQPSSVTLSWSCTDPEGKSITYDLFFDTMSTPQLYDTNLTQKNYFLDSLKPNLTYFWKIRAINTDNDTTIGPLWSFSTIINPPPTVPSNPWPVDNSQLYTYYDVELSWDCADPEGDSVYYIVMMGESTDSLSLRRSVSPTTNSSHQVHVYYYFISGNIYYWKVIAEDQAGNIVESPIWTIDFPYMGKIIYKDYSEISSITPGSSNSTRLTYAINDNKSCGNPALSPNYSKIVTAVYDNNTYKRSIYIFNGNDSSLNRLTLDTNENVQPCWSPDGSKICFVRQKWNTYGTYDDDYQLYTMNSNGSNIQRLTNFLPEFDTLMIFDPDWSPDGSKIIFTTRLNIHINSISRFYNDLFVINADGSNRINLTNTPELDEESPQWSPDGSQIVYICQDDIFIMNSDGSNRVNISNTDDSDERDPCWSPNGEWIGFARKDKGIYFMRKDGSSVVQIKYSSYAHSPDWGWGPN